MSGLQPLYDVKERLEYAAIAGTGLLGEDFRLQRAAENLKPLAAASPVFAKIDGGLTRLLSAPPEQRPGLLLDLLALVDAVAYTQAGTGMEGELAPLPVGSGRYCQISYGQIQPLLAALTTTGGGRVETVQSAWDNHPEFFQDYRVLPAVIGGLGDSYGEMAELCAKLLKTLGPSVVPALRRGFDPDGKKEMARRVEVIAAIEGAGATPWLREALPEAKKDVRAAVITALGADQDNAGLLLDLSKSERGKSRETVLRALALLDGEAVADFWRAEVEKRPENVEFLKTSRTDWASDLAAASLRSLLEEALPREGRNTQITREGLNALTECRAAVLGKTSAAMLDCWRWIDQQLPAFRQVTSAPDLHFHLAGSLGEWLLASLCQAGPGPLCGLCLELWEKHPKEPRYLPHAVAASLLTRSAAEVYDTFSPFVPTAKPLLGGEQKKELHNAVLKGLSRVSRDEDTGAYLVDGVWPAAQPLDPRWIKRLVHAAWRTPEGGGSAYRYGEAISGFDTILMRLADQRDPETRRELVPYLRQRMRLLGNYQTYSRWLFQLGGSPGGVLGEAMKKGKPAYLYYIWELLNDAAKALPGDEVAGLCREVLDAKWIRPTGNELFLANQALPWTIEQLRAGKPFPAWEDWWRMRK